jgi:hypothetical protein
MSLLRKFFGPAAVTAPAPNATLSPPAPVDDSEARLGAAMDLSGEAREAALLELAKQSRNATVRLRAASALTLAATWQTLQDAMQDRDRRVWKLMKDRLSALRQQERAQGEAARLEQELSEILARRPIDLVRLVDIDKRWAVVQQTAEPGAAPGEFPGLRALVDQRLAGEQHVQRELRRIAHEGASALELARGATPDVPELAIRMKLLQAEFEAVPLNDAPRSLLIEAQQRLAEFNTAVTGLMATHVRIEEARTQAQAIVEQVEALEAASLELIQNLEANWKTCALGTSELDETLRTRFSTGMEPLRAPHAEALAKAAEQARPPKPDNSAKKEVQDKLRTLIAETEAALEAGAAAVAIKLTDEMRVLRGLAGPLSPGWKSRLVAAEKQVAKLRGWQRFTGEKLREELILAADKLKESHLNPELLGKEITLLQDAWKKLDTEPTGGAPKPLWDRFHAATNTAYERVKAWREQANKDRETNAELRRALIAEAAPLAALFNNGVVPKPRAAAPERAPKPKPERGPREKRGAADAAASPAEAIAAEAAVAPDAVVAPEAADTDLIAAESSNTAALIAEVPLTTEAPAEPVSEPAQATADVAPPEVEDAATPAPNEAIVAADAEMPAAIDVPSEHAGPLIPPPPEAWRSLPGQRSSLHDRWHNAGPANRNDMKTLQAEFSAMMAVLDHAANNARKLEKQRKQALIAEVDAALISGQAAMDEAPPEAAPSARDSRPPARGGRDSRDGRDRNDRGGRDGGRDSERRGPPRDYAPPALLAAMRVAQDAQKRWQEQRHPMPLPRKEEQALWEAFRAKCSAIFALRDAKREAEKGKVAAQAGERQVLIDKMAALGEAADAAAATAHLHELLTAWNAMERVEGGARKRFDDALARARNRIDQLKREAAAAVAVKLLAFDTTLCKLEQSRAGSEPEIDTTGIVAQQAELAGAIARHKGLKARAERAITGTPTDWAKLVTGGTQARAALLLDLELTLGIESPAELSQARRARQLERLAEAMKNRAPAKPPEELLDALLALPAAPSDVNVVRLTAVVAHLEKPKR